ncbi:hypothetical protein EC990672_4985B, partial [Escherichia coli 99.0672]
PFCNYSSYYCYIYKYLLSVNKYSLPFP